MATTFFVIVALMLIAYSVLDGFDLGVGAIHWIVGRTRDERRTVISAIGPVWDGNEVWLIAAGGTLYFAFPALYASSFSGFYLPLTMVLWLLMLRGVSIEVRSHVNDPMWHSLFDFTFALSGALLAIFLGAALGNVIRGVPLGADGYFFEPLWTDFRTTGKIGVLDWYTVLVGVMSFVTLANHGAHWLALKTTAPLRERARRLSARLWWIVAVLTVAGWFGTVTVRPRILDNFRTPGLGWLIPIVAVGALAGMSLFGSRGKDLAAFISSCLYIAAMLGGASFGMYPTLLPATTDPARSLTISNSAAGAYGLGVGLVWWIFACILVIGYFCYVYWLFRHRVHVVTDTSYQ